MLGRMLNRFLSRWTSFSYNFGWSRYTILFDGWIARCAMAVPIVGYLVLFNDFVSKHIAFDHLAQETKTSFGLSATARLKFIYFGLILLGVANIIYRWRRPFVMKRGRSSDEYVERALSTFVLDDYINIHGSIRHEGHKTPYGDYSGSDYDEFVALASGEIGYPDNFTKSKGDWTRAKQKFEHLLRSMLIEFYFRNEITKRVSLCICIGLSLAGYFLLAVPSVDLFVKVMSVTF